MSKEKLWPIFYVNNGPAASASPKQIKTNTPSRIKAYIPNEERKKAAVFNPQGGA